MEIVQSGGVFTYFVQKNDESLFEAFDEAEEFRNTGILKGSDGRVREIRAAWEAAFGSKLDVKSITEELYYEMARRLRNQTSMYAVLWHSREKTARAFQIPNRF